MLKNEKNHKTKKEQVKLKFKMTETENIKNTNLLVYK